MWSSIGPAGRPDLFRDENATRYEVTGFPGKDGVYIDFKVAPLSLIRRGKRGGSRPGVVH